MPERSKQKFHEFALQSSVFKGRSDLYFCYLKTEKIAHAFAALFSGAGDSDAVLASVIQKGAMLPGKVAQFSAGTITDASILADIFELLSQVRFLVSETLLNAQNGMIICREYEQVAEKIAMGKNASFLTIEDFSVPVIALEKAAPGLPVASDLSVNKGQLIKDTQKTSEGQGQSVRENAQRTQSVLDAVIAKNRASIKDISSVVRGCSEKTIQRELNTLIQQGRVRKEGERRWSVYMPA